MVCDEVIEEKSRKMVLEKLGEDREVSDRGDKETMKGYKSERKISIGRVCL